jgi:mannose-6-phosphate isomerase-like protein (cupin superfamily)
VVVGPDTPHKFENSGTGRLEVACIHASPVFIQEHLEE